ncbi:AfsR/SARP family transcriptional regulator [Nonomuraea cavernae]|uniref:AfsR/SARP family transcriptional regulator n=1 Tax=Nonomuraea cavernae TaxID=2045107 RepID=UPI0033D06B74
MLSRDSRVQAPAPVSAYLQELHLSAVERRIDLVVADEHGCDVLAWVADLARRHPLRESLHVRLLGRCGRPAEALVHYERLRRRLADQLGVDISVVGSASIFTHSPQSPLSHPRPHRGCLPTRRCRGGAPRHRAR